MRKKSHISLTKFIVHSDGMEKLYQHRRAFYLGSVLPDCTPSFLIRRHSIDETFHVLRKEIEKITERYDMDKGISTYYCRHLGVITHYIADYFTFPHNSIYSGNMKEHCVYEKELKFALKEYVNREATKKNRSQSPLFKTVDEILEFIKRAHDMYLETIKKIEVDCEYIVNLCFQVVDAILHFFEINFNGKQVLC